MWINQSEKNGSSMLMTNGNFGFKDDIYGYNFVSDIGKIVLTIMETHLAGTVAAVSK
jgi:hypothetical protein